MSRNRMLRLLVTVSVVAIGVTSAGARDAKVVRVWDHCDPATFNADPPEGPGLGQICDPTPTGHTTFQRFIEELTERQEARAWRFSPENIRLHDGDETALDSRGGEFHTFTRVAEFGGGVVPVLNDLSDAGPPRPECEAAAGPTNIAVAAGSAVAGPTAGTAALPTGTTKWQCCIHPWMHAEITVK